MTQGSPAFTYAEAEEIRLLCKSFTQRTVARTLGVDDKIISLIVKRKTYCTPPSDKSDGRGDTFSYTAVHKRLRKVRGTPSHCEFCGTTSARKFEWAYAGPGHASREATFSSDLDDYIRLCTSCHWQFDNGEEVMV